MSTLNNTANVHFPRQGTAGSIAQGERAHKPGYAQSKVICKP